jgi:hypothetical protein
MDPRNYTALQNERARALADAQSHADRVDEMHAQSKPSPDRVMTFEDAELLVQAFEYADGEAIGVVRVGTSDAVQQLRVFRGEVVADGRHDIVRLPRYKRGSIPVDGHGWTAQQVNRA